jgi:hypothetical protein
MSEVMPEWPSMRELKEEDSIDSALTRRQEQDYAAASRFTTAAQCGPLEIGDCHITSMQEAAKVKENLVFIRSRTSRGFSGL